VAAVYDGTNKYIYVDGVLDAAVPAAGTIAQNSYPVCIGENGESLEHLWNGLIDEVSIYNRALSALEIQTIYAEGSGGKCPIPPAIITQPASCTNIAGTTAMFSVTAGGTAPLSYQWLKNGSTLTNGGNVSGAIMTNLALSNVQDADAASYTVAVANSSGSVTSAQTVLSVLDPPVITAHPLSQAASMGATVLLSVSASGAPPLSYQWLKASTNLPGATGTTFSLTNVGRRDSGTYVALVSNPGGSTLSSNAIITVSVPQRLCFREIQPDGTIVLMSCDADGGALTPEDLPDFEAQTSTNLTDWVTLSGALTLTNGSLVLLDCGSTNWPARFYRIIEH
jgi:hypothetical protein